MLWDFLVFISIYLLLGLILVVAIKPVVKLSPSIFGYVVLAIIFRGGLTFYYYLYTLGVSADAWKYFSYAKSSAFSIEKLFEPGTNFILNSTSIVYHFASLFANPYLMCYIPYSLCGLIGSLLMFQILKSKTTLKSTEVLILSFFLPNLIFWTSNLGKDSIIFLGIMLAFSGAIATSIKGRLAMAISGGGLIFLVRPHILFFLISGFVLGAFGERGKKDFRTIALVGVAIIGLLIAFRPILGFVRFDLPSETESGEIISSTYEIAVDRMESSSNNLNYGGAATGVSPIKMLLAPIYLVNFICAPFFWQVRKVIHAIGATESLIYQFIILYIAFNIKFFISSKTLPFKYSWLLYVFIAGAILGATYTNFGLSTRQRCMVIPFVVVFYAITKSEKIRQKLEKKKQAVSPQVSNKAFLPFKPLTSLNGPAPYAKTPPFNNHHRT